MQYIYVLPSQLSVCHVSNSQRSVFSLSMFLQVFVSQHALAVHILSEHMNQRRVNSEEDAGNIPTSAEDGQVVNISETIEIPIGEEMVLVQSVEPG